MESLEAFEAAEVVVDADEQKSNEWFRKRCGKLTCSHFDDLMKAGKKEEFSQTALTYLRRVAAERMDSAYYGGGSASTAFGIENESVAVEALRERFPHWNIDYDSKRFVELSEWIGGSPDGLIDDDACLEIKCPFDPGVHLQNAVSQIVPADYYWQCVGHCLITGRRKTVFVSFDPRLPKRVSTRLVVMEVVPTEGELNALRQKLEKAVSVVESILNAVGFTESEAEIDKRRLDELLQHLTDEAATRIREPKLAWWCGEFLNEFQAFKQKMRTLVAEGWDQ